MGSKVKLHFREPHVLARRRFPSFLKSLFSGGSRPSDKGEGGGGGHPDPEIRGGGGAVLKNWEKNFGQKVRWGGGGSGPSGPSPGSATALPEREQAV